MSTTSHEVEKSYHSAETTSGFRRHKKLLIIAGVIVAVCVLALGLGLGIGLHRQSSSSSSDDSAAATTATGISPSSTATGATPTGTGSSWQPAVNTTFNYQLSVVPTSNSTHGISVWFIDLFAASEKVIAGLQGDGAKIVCYFSAGSSEDWRPDFKQFQESDLGNDLRGWNGEKWVDTRSNTVRTVMKARMDMAASKKCDGVDPDNMDAYDNEGGGFSLTTNDATDYARFLATEASSRGLAIGLKNAAKIIPNVIDVMAWSVNEQCVAFKECDTFSGFIKAGKPVFNIEYPKGDETNNNDTLSTETVSKFCNQQMNKNEGFSSILKNMNLDRWIEFCNGTSTVLS